MNGNDFTIIIINYNDSSRLYTCLKSIKQFLSPEKIIVVDNASTDDSVSKVRDNFEDIKVIQNEKNLGYSAAINIGLKEVETSFTVILNSDTEFESDIISGMIDLYKTDPKTGVCGCRLKSGSNIPQRSYFKFPTLTGRMLYYTGLNKIINIEKINKNSEKITDVDVVCGAFLLFKTELLQDTGGFDEDYFLYHEEADLCHRMKKKGFRNLIFNDFQLIHYGSVHEETSNPVVYFHRNRSLLIYFHKNRSSLALSVLLKLNILFLFLKYLIILNIEKKKLVSNVLKYHFIFIRFLFSRDKSAGYP